MIEVFFTLFLNLFQRGSVINEKIYFFVLLLNCVSQFFVRSVFV